MMTSPGAYSRRWVGSIDVPFTCVIGRSAEIEGGTNDTKDTPESETLRLNPQGLSRLAGRAFQWLGRVYLWFGCWFGLGFTSASASVFASFAPECVYPERASMQLLAGPSSARVLATGSLVVSAGLSFLVSRFLRCGLRFRREFSGVEAVIAADQVFCWGAPE
jgi:hypothetical protein